MGNPVSFGDGATLTTSFAAVLTVPAVTNSWRPLMELYNVDSVTHTVTWQLNPNGSGDVTAGTVDIPTLGKVYLPFPDQPADAIIKAKATANSVVRWWLWTEQEAEEV